MAIAIYWYLQLAVLVVILNETVQLSDEKRLIKDLLKTYETVGKIGRPVLNTSKTITVDFGVALIQILDLDEKNQVLTTNVWTRYNWDDVVLRWRPEDYGGVQIVRVPSDKIWTPDIVLYNYADDRLKEQREALIVVEYTGHILWIPQAIYKSTCSIDITHFPFDIQKCRLKFGSWTYDGFKLDVGFFDGKEEIDLNDYIQSNEWDILEHPARKNEKFYPCCREPYPDLSFYLTLRRKVAFYNYILILPCVLLSSLTLVLFWLPPESPAKMVLGMNIFVAFFVLLLLLAESTPPAASNIPLIGAYYCLNMIMITLSTFLSVIVINLYFRGDKRNRVPRWVKRLFVDFLSRLMCMRSEIMPPDMEKRMNANSEGGGRHAKDRKKIKCPELKYNKFQMQDLKQEGTGNSCANHSETISPDKSPILVRQSVENDIREIRRYIRILITRMQNKEELSKITMEWRVVALVLDRLFFFMYLAAIIISLATIFPRTG